MSGTNLSAKTFLHLSWQVSLVNIVSSMDDSCVTLGKHAALMIVAMAAATGAAAEVPKKGLKDVLPR